MPTRLSGPTHRSAASPHRGHLRAALLLCAALAVPALGVGRTLRRQSPDDLLHRATRFTDQHKWHSPQYFWLPPTTLVRIVIPSHGTWYLAEKGKPDRPERAMPGLTGVALHAEIVTAEAPPEGDSLIGEATPIPDENYVLGLSPSPDGKWLLCPGTIHDRTKLILKEIRTRKQHVCTASYSESRPGDLQQAWMPDSSGWVTALVDIHGVSLQIRNVHSPDRVRKIRVQGSLGNILLGITADNKLLSTDFTSENDNSALLTFCDLSGHSKSTRSLSVSLPKGQHSEDVALSPRGDRLLWVTEKIPPPDGSKISLTAQTSQKEEAVPSATFWVTRTDGTGWTCVGSLALRKLMDRSGPRSGLHWLPDNAHVSFTYDKSLWTVPIDVAPR